MLPKYIKVQNFASYKNETIDFTKFGNLFILTGENGSGKSSIIDMITVSVFFRCKGTDAKGAGMEELIHEGNDSFKIEYCFDMNNNTYTIIREKFKKSGQALQLFINNENHTGKLLETQQKVLDIFKMDYDTFMDTIIIGQGESASFMKKSATERKKVIAQILNLDKYDILEDYTKDLKKQIKTKIEISDVQISNLYDSIKNKDKFIDELKQLEQDIKIINNNIVINEKELELEVIEKTKYEELKKQQDNIINRKNNIITNINTIETDIQKFTRIKGEIEIVLANKNKILENILQINKNVIEITDSEKVFRAEKTTLETENKIYISNAEELKNKFTRLKDYNECDCQFCGQNISNEYKEQHLNDIKSEGTIYQSKKNENSLKIESINIELADIKSQLNTLKIKLNELNQYKTKIDQAEVKIESVISKLSDLNIRLNELNIENKELSDITIVNIETKTFKDITIKNELTNLRQNQSIKKSRIGAIQNELDKISENEKKYSNEKKEYDKMKNTMSMYNELQKAWGKNGIQAIIIDNILPQIEEEINKYLQLLSANKISIKFETQKEAKNGNKSETLDIVVSDSKGSRSYERYSGGQRTRIDFACHIGMSKFLAKRSGSNIEFFVIDEGIGTLDDAGKQNFLETLKLLTTIFDQVMCISHIPEILESFDNKILIINDIDEGSKLSIIG